LSSRKFAAYASKSLFLRTLVPGTRFYCRLCAWLASLDPCEAVVRIHRGMIPPLGTQGSTLTTPAFIDDGHIYVLSWNGGRRITVFESDGSQGAPITVADTQTEALAFDACSGLLLAGGEGATQFAEGKRGVPHIIAIDVRKAASGGTRRTVWESGFDISSCYGIALLPAALPVLPPGTAGDAAATSASSVAIISAMMEGWRSNEGSLHALRVADGSRISRLVLPDAEYPSFLAADAATSTIYASVTAAAGGSIRAFEWDSDRQALSRTDWQTVVEGIQYHPVTVVPPVSGRRTSYLVVGTVTQPTILVFALPSRRLIHRHALDSMGVRGLAAEPSGEALAVCDDYAKCVHVLPWPLPGMHLED
jgi:hypothetical protein